MSTKAEHSILVEIQKMFPRQQRGTNAFEVFLEVFNRNNRVDQDFGEFINDEDFYLLFENSEGEHRYYNGSEYVHKILYRYNTIFLLAICVELYNESKNRSIGREIVRALIKRIIETTHNSLFASFGGNKITIHNLELPRNSQIYKSVFDSKKILKHVRSKTKKRIKKQFLKYNPISRSLDINHSDLINICEANGMINLAKLLNNSYRDTNEDFSNFFPGFYSMFTLFTKKSISKRITSLSN